MLRTTVSYILMLACTGLMAQMPGQDRNATDEQGQKQGLWTKIWPTTGKVRYTGQFKNDKPIGVFKYYDEKGLLTSTMKFNEGSERTDAKHYHPNSELMASGAYIGKTKDSTWHYYDEMAQLRKVETFVQGKVHGSVRTYFRDGSIADKSQFDNGVQVGVWTQYHIAGAKRAEAFFVNGEPDGEMNWYFEDGKPEIKGKYKNGVKHGGWIYFNEDGSIQLQMLYEEGEFVKSAKENGVFKDYYDDDQVKNEVTWVNGKKNGPFKEYFDNGVWEERVTKADPVLGIDGGEQEKVLVGQSIRMTGNFKDDQLHGVVKTFNVKGKVVKEEKYVNGVLE